jgi:hypothetical protein
MTVVRKTKNKNQNKEKITTTKVVVKPFSKRKPYFKTKFARIAPSQRFKRFVKMMGGNQTKQRGILAKQNEAHNTITDYAHSLFKPECALGARVSQQYLSTCCKKFVNTVRITTNNTGNFSIVFEPSFVMNSTAATQQSTLFLNNTTGYNGSAPQGTNDATSQQMVWGYASNTIENIRIVSCSLEAISVTSNLNKSGTLYGAVVPVKPITPVNVGGTAGFNGDILALTTVGALTTRPMGTYAKAYVNNGQGLRLIWLPTCLDQIEMYGDQQSFANTGGSYDPVNQFFIIGVGLPASSSVELTITQNFEYVPYPNTLNSGTELTTKDNRAPGLAWKQVAETSLAKVVKANGPIYYDNFQISDNNMNNLKSHENHGFTHNDHDDNTENGRLVDKLLETHIHDNNDKYSDNQPYRIPNGISQKDFDNYIIKAARLRN